MGLKAGGAARGQRAVGRKGAGGGKPAGRRRGFAVAPGASARAASAPIASPFNPGSDWRAVVRATVEGLHFELVDVERAMRGLLRVTIDRRAGHVYATASQSITVEDCEAVTRQLQYALEVDGVDYARLEVSSPGLDRPLRTLADYERFCGQAVSLTLKLPFQGRRHFQGALGRAGASWQIVFDDGKAEHALSFTLDEVREARLVPVVNFKGRSDPAAVPEEALTVREVDGGNAR